VARITEDFVRYMTLANALLAQAPSELREHKFAQLLDEASEEIVSRGSFMDEIQAELGARPLKRLRRMLTVESIFEDLEIIENSARAILNIKEDLIGPVRKREETLISLEDLLSETVASMGIPDGVARILFSDDLPFVRGDRNQLERVFINLIKNAMEAMYETEDKRLFIWGREADEPGFVIVDVTDNGPGIPSEIIEKIWMAFYTTKGDRGGTGLGLAACVQIVGQMDGKITVESDVGVGTTFSVLLPIAEEGANA
jgi:signal transduction histidine kinase